MGFREVSDMGRYLGVPITHSRVTKKTYQYILDRMRTKITVWNATRLSLAGRLTLSQSVLAAMPLYAMQTARVPIGTCYDMEKTMRGFLWNSSEEHRRMSLVAWPTVLKSKADGGLGLRDLHTVNNAFGIKLCWEIFTKPDELWVRLLLGKYKFDVHGELLPISPPSCSPLWRLICENWASMLSNTAWIVGNGNRVLFWEHSWIPGLNTKLLDCVVSRVPDNLRFKSISFFASLEGNWKWSLFENFIPDAIIHHIAAVLPPCSNSDVDMPFWRPSSSGCFSLKTAYESLCPSHDHVERMPWSRIWKWVGPQRIKTFMWLLLNNGVLTNVERNRRHLLPGTRCEVCNNYDETSLHLLRDCRFASNVWDRIVVFEQRTWFFDNALDMKDWLFRNLSEKKCYRVNIPWNLLFGVVIWLLWKRRNRVVMGGDTQQPPFSVAQLAVVAVQQAQQVIAAATLLTSGRGGNARGCLVSWRRPPVNVFKLNSDASLADGSNIAYGGGVIRDNNGYWHGGFVVNIGSCSILGAEMWCVYYGLDYAKSLALEDLQVECDNLLVVNMINGSFQVNPLVASLVDRIRSLMSSFRGVTVSHIHREGNFVADALSHHAYDFSPGLHHLAAPPNTVLPWLLHDLVGVSYVR